jgi:hypothetical protein
MGGPAKETKSMEPLQALYATIDEIPENFRPLYEERGGQFHIAKINGIKTDADVARIQRALDAEKKDHGTLKTKWGGFFGDKKPEDITSQLDRITELETIAASKNINQETLNELADTRARSKIAPLERQLQTLQTEIQTRDQKLQEFATRETTRTIHDAVRGEAAKMKVIDSAQEDVLMLAERVFEVNEAGETVTKDGIKGVTPGLSPNVWLTEQQAKRPHWWPQSKGGGAGGSNGGPGGPNPFSKDGWNLTEQGKVYSSDPARARQLAEAAGTTVGGMRPAK